MDHKIYAVSTLWEQYNQKGKETRHRLRIIKCESEEVAFSTVYDYHIESEMQDFALVSKLVLDTNITTPTIKESKPQPSEES